MKRTIAISTIVLYLGSLACGIASHTLQFGNAAHPAMYYVVWDMFCGWSGYETRNHLIAQGASGQYYRLTPVPWGDYQPYGPANRIDYDSFAMHGGAIARNILRNTEHEPIQQVYLIEENWSKRYNIPDYLWRFEEPKEKHSYFHTRVTYNGDCEAIDAKMSWHSAIQAHHLNTNARLAQLRKNSRKVFAVAEPKLLPPQHAAPISANGNSQIQPVSFQTTH